MASDADPGDLPLVGDPLAVRVDVGEARCRRACAGCPAWCRSRSGARPAWADSTRVRGGRYAVSARRRLGIAGMIAGVVDGQW